MNLAEIRAALAYEGLSLRDAIQLDPFTHPTLEELYVSGDPLSEDCARALARSRFPALRRLVLSPSSERGVSNFEPFVEIIGALDAPRLEEAHFSISDVSVLAIAIPRCAAAGLKRVSFAFTALADEEKLLDALGSVRVPEGFEVGLSLAAARSRSFTREATARFPWLCDAAEWSWAECGPSVIRNW